MATAFLWPLITLTHNNGHSDNSQASLYQHQYNLKIICIWNIQRLFSHNSPLQWQCNKCNWRLIRLFPQFDQKGCAEVAVLTNRKRSKKYNLTPENICKSAEILCQLWLHFGIIRDEKGNMGITLLDKKGFNWDEDKNKILWSRETLQWISCCNLQSFSTNGDAAHKRINFTLHLLQSPKGSTFSILSRSTTEILFSGIKI